MVKVVTTITDTDGNPLGGATVKVKGKPVGVIADMDGKVSLWVDRGNTITVSYLGMKSKTIKVTSALTKNIVLENDASLLDQVVVTGYTRTTKRRTTGSVSTITAEDLNKNPTANLDMLLQGKNGGCRCQSALWTSRRVCQSAHSWYQYHYWKCRPVVGGRWGSTSKDLPTISKAQMLSGNFSDIFSNGIAGINPNDIESVTVLKDASAAAIYGSRAAGGVIVVTTKRGVAGKLRINYSANATMVTRPPRAVDLMDSREKLAWEQELWDEYSKPYFEKNERYPVVGIVGMIRSGYGQYKGMNKEQQDAEIARLGSHTTNWFEELFRNSVSQSHNLSLSGGSEKSTFYVSLGYSENAGLVKKTDYSRYNINSKLDIKPNKRVKLGLSLDLGWQTSNSPSLAVDLFKYAYFANPYERVYDEQGNYAADQTYYNIMLANGSKSTLPLPDNGVNIMREINNTSSKTKNFSTTVIGNITINIIDNLNFEGLGSYSYTTNNGDNINDKDTYTAGKIVLSI
ncbi:MAG: carboxypeptidase-like regulatory domain-containing protein [Hoylesella buccalis]